MLTTDSDVRMIDFGIALLSDADVSRIEGIAGSPSYMSPEQVQSLELTNRSDLYSLGAVMYEMLTGHRPFRAGALAKLLHQIVYATPPPMLTLRPDLPPELEAVVAIGDAQGAGEALPERRGVRDAIARVHQQRSDTDRIDRQEHFALLRRLKFFHDFSSAEIWEVLRAGTWQDHARGDEIVRAGGIDDRFYVIVYGDCNVERDGTDRRPPRGRRLLRRDELPARREAAGGGHRGRRASRSCASARRCSSRPHPPASCASTRCS